MHGHDYEGGYDCREWQRSLWAPEMEAQLLERKHHAYAQGQHQEYENNVLVRHHA